MPVSSLYIVNTKRLQIAFGRFHFKPSLYVKLKVQYNLINVVKRAIKKIFTETASVAIIDSVFSILRRWSNKKVERRAAIKCALALVLLV